MPEQNNGPTRGLTPGAMLALGLSGAAVLGGVIFWVTRDNKSPKRGKGGRPKLIPASTQPQGGGRRPPGGGARPAGGGGARPAGGGARPAGGGGKPRPSGGAKKKPPPGPSGGRRPSSGSGRRPSGGRRPTRPSKGGGRPPKAPVVEPGSLQSKIAGGGERRHAARAVVEQPRAHPQRGLEKREDQALADWLANVAYWNAYPNAPTKLDPKDRAHKNHIHAWVRIRQYVGKGLSLLPNLGPHPMKPDANDRGQNNWKRWALAVSFGSPLRTASALREGFKKAWNYVFLDNHGVAWQHQHVGKNRGGLRASLEGLMAEVAVAMQRGSRKDGVATLDRWPETMTKAFASAHNTMETA